MSNRVEYFIARRTGAEGRSSMERVAVVAVALSLSVMIMTLAVIFGFKRDIHSKLTTLSGEMVITSHYGPSSSFIEPILRGDVLPSFIKEVAAGEGYNPYRIAPYALCSAILRAPDGVDGVVLKGIDSLYNIEVLERSIVAGDMLDLTSNAAVARASRSALISQKM
ncbi:MAG: hypothetical protein SNG97_01160, partial [Rikenellaceae bacterium]